MKLGIAMQSRVENVVRNPESESPLIGDPTGEFREVVLFFGIIDILQDYDISKKLEHAYKSQLYDPNSISAVGDLPCLELPYRPALPCLELP